MKTKKTKITPLGVLGTGRAGRLKRETAIHLLCKLAAQLHVPVVSLINWPDNAGWRADARAVYIHGSSRVTRSLLERLHVPAPVIVIRAHCSTPHVIAHEISHHVAKMSDYFDSRMGKTMTPRLQMTAIRAGFAPYFWSSRSELRAECGGRRLLGIKLPPILRRLTERAWADLEWRLR